MKRTIGCALFVTAICVATVAAAAADQEPPNLKAGQEPAVSAQQPAPNESAQPTLSNGIAEILQMVDAGVSKDVLEAFIESSPVPYQLTASDVIALKQKRIGDNITVALLQHGTKLRAARAQSAPVPFPASAPAPRVVYRPGPMGLDPDSYEYFQYYYLHPRTLASVYQRLGVYGAPYPYGPYRPFGLHYPGVGFGP